MTEESTTTLQGNAARIKALVAQLTLEEKAALTVGRDTWTTYPVPRLGIPSIWLADGPTGLRKARSASEIGLGSSLPATCYPTASALSASWDTTLLRAVGRALGLEAQAQGVQILLGPGVNLKRSPLCGRNFEYLSEDPLLSGKLAAALIAGVQAEGVGTSLKHLVANEQETGRMYVDSVLDERTLRELYLRPFEIAVAEAEPWTLMAAYNRLNGTYCTEHEHLLHDIVEREWGYQGIVVSDWGAVNDRVAGISAGMHLQMPAGPSAQVLVTAVREGTLAEERLDQLVGAILTCIFKADAARRPATTVDLDAHHQLARRAAAASIVLLKNDGPLLPIEGEARREIALIGSFARQPRYQGAGSSQVMPTREENLLDELSRLLGAEGQVHYAAGYAVGAHETPDPALLREAQDLAARARLAVVVVGLPGSYESEGGDRTHLDLPAAHNALVEAVVQVQPQTAVVLINGSAVALPWASRVPAIVEGWLGGQGGGGALADVLLGQVTPSGKLAETFPNRLEDTPAYLQFPGDRQGQARFGEELYTGYRWYDARRIEPLFPFGHGLSYTTFAYSNLALEPRQSSDTESITVSLQVRNTGGRAGQEVVQIYVRERSPRLPRPDKELKAFGKVALAPGEEQELSFQLGHRDFAFYDPRTQAWATTSGTFDILVGASSADIRLQQSITLEASSMQGTPLDRLSPLSEWLQHPAARDALLPAIAAFKRAFIGDQVEAQDSAEAGDEGNTLQAFLFDLPLSKLVVFGALDEQQLQGLIAAVQQEGSSGV